VSSSSAKEIRSLISKKKYKTAQKALDKARKKKPKSAQLSYLQGLILLEQGSVAEALQCYVLANKLAPLETEYLNELGRLLLASERYAQAAQCFKQSLTIEPNAASVVRELAKAAEYSGNSKQALVLYQKALQLEPLDAETHVCIAKAHQFQRQHSLAIGQLEQAINLSLASPRVYYLLARLYQESGNADQAKHAYEQSLKLDSAHFASMQGLIELDSAYADLSLYERLTALDEATQKDPVYFLLLASCARNAGEFERELQLLLSAHERYLKSGVRFSLSSSEYLDHLARLPDQVKDYDFQVSESFLNAEPIFIVGTPRSGSTLAESVLSAGSAEMPSVEESSVAIYALKQHYLSNITRAKGSQEPSEGSVRLSQGFVSIVKDAYDSLGLFRGETGFTDKSLENIFFVDILLQLFPKAKVIFCDRKPLASIISILQRNLVSLSWAHNIDDILEYFNACYAAADKWEQMFPDSFFRFSYEAFVESPEAKSKDLFRFCGLEWTQEVLAFNAQKKVSMTASNVQIRKGINKDSVNRDQAYQEFFKDYLSRYPWLNSHKV
jgi:Flp pilus assembly protein TadD